MDPTQTLIGQRPTFDDVYDALVNVGRPLLRQRFHARCCIAASRMVLTVLHECGHLARAVPVEVTAGNQRFVAAVADRLPPEEWAPTGVKMVQTDSGGDEYPAHLVVVSNGEIVDLAVEQFNRPAKRIHVPNVVRVEVPDGWKTNDEPVAVWLKGGGVLMYRPIEVEPDYRAGRDWHQRERTDDIARCVLDALRGDQR